MDYDGDGQVYIVLDFVHTENGPGCGTAPDEGWNAVGVDGPSLLLHALKLGRFTLHDEIARQYRRGICPPSARLAPTRLDSIRGDQALVQALLCAQAEGTSPAALHATVDAFCTVAYDNQKDCRVQRRHVCRFPEVLHAWIDSLYQVELWASGWTPLGDCSRCCPRAEARTHNGPAAALGRRTWF